MESNSVFAIAPYLAFGLLAAGILLRSLLALRHANDLSQELATELSEARKAFAGRLWWISMLTLLAGHLAGLLFPQSVMWWDASPTRLYMLEGLAGIVGLTALLTSIAIVARLIRRPTASFLTELFESVFLAFLFVGVVSGVLVAIVHRWGSSWGAAILTPYAMSILRGQPAPELAAQMPFLVRLHVLSAFAAVALVPLTRLAVFPIVAINRCLALASTPIRAGADALSAWMTKHNPSAWFWPEED
jgi:nitrate reductase gamma subunit